MNGRFFIFLGLLAVAALISLQESRRQIEQGYRIAKLEEEIRKVEQAIEIERARLIAMKEPGHIMKRISQLGLDIEPAPGVPIFEPASNRRPSGGLGSRGALPALDGRNGRTRSGGGH